MPVTLHEVAQKLGLSIATVSRALDDYPDIAFKTRQRVQQAAQDMGYAPNRAARQLRRNKADAIGYILPSDTPRFADPFFAEFLVGLGDETACHPFDLVISIAPPGQQGEQHIYENWVQSHKVDGFVLNRLRHNDWRVHFLAEQKVPFVTLESSEESAPNPRIEVDNRGGMHALVAHLAEAGYSRLAFIGGPLELVIQNQRLIGFREGLDKLGLPFSPDLCWVTEMTSNGGYEAAQKIQWHHEPPDAVVCINDETAFGVLHALQEKGFKVGAEVGVTGFDGVQVSQHTSPPLTTLDVPVSEIARQLVRMLAKELNHEFVDEGRVVIQPRLLVRASTNKNPTVEIK
jgi:LacI family transcriptional regulator